MLERSLEILRPLNEPRVLVESITFLGMVMELTGNYARALELYSGGAGDRHGDWRSVVRSVVSHPAYCASRDHP